MLMTMLGITFKLGKAFDGDPLFLLFFNIVAHMVAFLTNRAKVDGQVSGVVHHLINGRLSILQ